MEAMFFAVPVLALVTYLFAFPHYKFSTQIVFFLIIIITAIVMFTGSVNLINRRMICCAILGLVMCINVLRITSPQI